MNKNQLLARLTILTLLVILLSACGGAGAATPAEVTAPTSIPAPTSVHAAAVELADPAAIAQSFYQAMNAADIDAAMALVAEDVKCRGACYLNGKESFRFFMQGSINMGGHVELSDLQVDGNQVSYRWTAYNTDNIPVAYGTETLQVESGLIGFMETLPGTGAPQAENVPDPVKVAQNYYEALNAGEFETMASFMAEDMVATNPAGAIYGKQEVITANQDAIGDGLTFNETNFVHTGNGRVTSCYEVLQNGTLIDKGCDNVTHVRDGKIIYDGLESAEKVWIAQKYYEALAARNLDLALSYAADDMVATDTTGYYYGKSEIAAATQRGFDEGAAIEASDFKLEGDRVLSCYEYYKNGTLLDQSCSNVTRVRDGKIVFDGIESLESLFVVQEFYEALNAGDVSTAMSWIAPDAVFANPTGTYEGESQIRSSLEQQVQDGITFDLSNFHMVASRVSYEYKVMQGGNLLDQGTNGLTIIKNGLVVFDGTEDTFARQ